MTTPKSQAPSSREYRSGRARHSVRAVAGRTIVGAHGVTRPTRYCTLKLGISVGFAICCLALSARAQFSIDWFTIDGGGGTSTGGVYAVSGTIAQPDAGPAMTGANFSLTGGFWSLISVVQSPGAPLLTITLTSTNTALVSWPSPSTGFNLQQNTQGPGTVNWSNVVTTPIDNGTIKYLIVNTPNGNRFYRLSKP